MRIGDWTSNSHRLSGSHVIDLSKLSIYEPEVEETTTMNNENLELDTISLGKGLEELEEFIEGDREQNKRLKFEEKFGITHPENQGHSGMCLSYRNFMDYVFPVFADEIKGKSRQEAIQILLDFQKDYGNITLSSCKYNLEQLVLAAKEI